MLKLGQNVLNSAELQNQNSSCHPGLKTTTMTIRHVAHVQAIDLIGAAAATGTSQKTATANATACLRLTVVCVLCCLWRGIFNLTSFTV